MEDICAKCIEETLTPENVCATFDNIHLLDNSLTNKCLAVMKTNTEKILADGSLMQMKDSAVNMILNQDALAIPCESALVTPMLKWAKNQCVIAELKDSAANRRKMLKDRIYLIRFGSMSGETFTKCLSQVGDGFFSHDEVYDTMLSIAMGPVYLRKSAVKPFSCIQRSSCLIVNARMVDNYRKSASFTEMIYSKHGDKKISILGFESEIKINGISQKGNTIKFTRKDSMYTFNTPLLFEMCECYFNITSDDKRICIVTEAADSNIFMNINSHTHMKSIVYK